MAAGEPKGRAQNRLGTVLRGKYRLEAVLGVGAMAIVYKATHRNQAEYAIKMLHPELSYNVDLRARFLREGYAANSVKHPGVVRVVDDDVSEDGAAFLVMELLDGVVCEDIPSRHGGRLPLHAACVLAVQLLDVLAAAHAKDIIHRDIKPANLFITRDGTLKVLDFGIARVRDTISTDARATGTGIFLGTPAFMAPEQATGKASDVDARADLWAVGATVFTLVTGATVHDAETAPQLLVKLATQHARSLAALVPDAPAAVVAAIDRALAFEKEKRWPTAIAMRDALASACRESFPDSSPHALLASLLLSPPAHDGSPLDGSSKRASHPSSGGRSPFPVDLPFDATVSASTGSPPAGIAVETSRPVAASKTTPKRRSARGVIVSLAACGALASTVGVALTLRGRHAARPPAVTPTGPAGTSGASPGAAPAMAVPVAPSRVIAAADAALDAAAQNASGPSASEGFVRKGEAAPRPKIAAPQPPPAPRAGPASTPMVRPEPPPPAPARPPSPPTTTSPVPAPDPLDGRR